MRKQLFLVVSLVVASSPARPDGPLTWVPVANPGNTADTAENCLDSPNDCGVVDHAYFISKYETTNAQYAEFLNAVDPGGSNTLALYETGMSTDMSNGGIGFFSSNASGSKYVVATGFENKPVTYISFSDALRFSNWLNNGQGSGDTETGAYTITPDGITNNTITRNIGANIFLPSENEWYKAAYFDGTSYFAYPAGTDTPTVFAVPGPTANTANCDGYLPVTAVGAYTGSPSPYGTFDQGGNVREWNEAPGLRGGERGNNCVVLGASFPRVGVPPFEGGAGFRVASLSNWVPVANPGNAADTAENCLGSPTDCGVVDHAYFIAQHETTNAQYSEFLNAKAASDPNSLYNASMDLDESNGGIRQEGDSGSYTYTVKAGFANKPVTYVTFYDALRFANWLHNGKGSGDTETGAYTITPEGITNNTIVRNPGAQVLLPSENEWYKAAYFNGTSYFDYPVGTDTQTVCAAPTATANRANCDSEVGAVTDAGGYTGSASPYGTFDQGGNVWEWNETTSGSARGIRGGSWLNVAGRLAASDPIYNGPSFESSDIGFRVASPVPEPGTGWLGMTAALSLAAWRKRSEKAL
jgi:formylglycine-generating enzyme required for sulfatase activity